MIFLSLAGSLAILVAACNVVHAQPSPEVQRRISAAIQAAIINGPSNTDYTAFVNTFIGTNILGDVCPGASVSSGMVKITTNMTGCAPSQVALLLNKTADEAKYANRSLEFKNYRDIWDPDVTSDGFRGFMQKRYANGTFEPEDPADCSPKDTQKSRVCVQQSDDTVGFYESSSWEYSWFTPRDMAHLITLIGGNTIFIKQLDHFFDAGYYMPGNEPSFQIPIGYHYADTPASTVDAVRRAVFSDFHIIYVRQAVSGDLLSPRPEPSAVYKYILPVDKDKMILDKVFNN